MVHLLFTPFCNQEMILPMNFEGGRVKIEVRGTLLNVFAGKFHRLCRAYILQRLWVQLFLIKTLLICKISLNSRLIRLDQHETTFTGKNPRENALNIILLAKSSVFSSVGQWSERVRGLQAVRVQTLTEPNFFRLFVCLFFGGGFFLLLVWFP